MQNTQIVYIDMTVYKYVDVCTIYDYIQKHIANNVMKKYD